MSTWLSYVGRTTPAGKPHSRLMERHSQTTLLHYRRTKVYNLVDMASENMKQSAKDKGGRGRAATPASKPGTVGQGNPQTPTDPPDSEKLHSDPCVRAANSEDEFFSRVRAQNVSPEPEDEERKVSREEMRQITKALRLNYDIPEAELKASPATMLRILANPDSTPRSKAGAVKVLLAMRKFHLEQIKTLHDIGLLNPHEDDVRIVRTPLPGPGPMFGEDDVDEDADDE